MCSSDLNRDHDLTGNWRGHRECHIQPDWLLIYRCLLYTSEVSKHISKAAVWPGGTGACPLHVRDHHSPGFCDKTDGGAADRRDAAAVRPCGDFCTDAGFWKEAVAVYR